MDPAKLIGKVKEQVRMEHKCRRNYPNTWSKISDAETNRFYNQEEIDKLLEDKLKLQDLCPFEHNNKGESYFISPAMHKALLTNCRCGRPRRGAHMGKCLQRPLDPLLSIEQSDENKEKKVPSTSNSHIGFASLPSYHKLEQSMRYVSPTYSMPGPRVTKAPYNVIIIG